MKKLLKFFKEEDGISAVEYGIIGAIMAAFLVGGFAVVTGALNRSYTKIDDAIPQ